MSTPAGGERGGVSPSSAALQIGLIALAFYLWPLPIIQPIKMMVVLLHEMSHGLMALASGGTVHAILITPDEGGACESHGGNAILVAGAGYLGSMFFGGMILRASRKCGGEVPITCSLLALLVLGAAVTVLHDPYSRTFAFTLAGTFIFLGLMAPKFLGALVLRVIGTVSSLYAIVDIYSDLVVGGAGGDSLENDAQTFAALTGVPAELVGLLWLAVSLLFFAMILRSSLESSPGSTPVARGAAA